MTAFRYGLAALALLVTTPRAAHATIGPDAGLPESYLSANPPNIGAYVSTGGN